MNFKENFVRALAVKNIAGNGSQPYAVGDYEDENINLK